MVAESFMHKIIMFPLRLIYIRRADHRQVNLFVLFNRGEREECFFSLLEKKPAYHMRSFSICLITFRENLKFKMTGRR
jgi:hypothetical protein